MRHGNPPPLVDDERGRNRSETAVLTHDIVSPRDGEWAIESNFSRTPYTEKLPVRIGVREHGADAPHYIDLAEQPQKIPVSLHRGLNRIELTAQVDPELPADSPIPLLELDGLRLTR